MHIECTGSARLRADGSALAYDETVSFVLGGKRICATRAYRYASSGDSIVATFEDGVPFFVLRLDARGVGYATHVCGADTYALTSTLRAPDTWQTRWSVTGTKRLVIGSHYER